MNEIAFASKDDLILRHFSLATAEVVTFVLLRFYLRVPVGCIMCKTSLQITCFVLHPIV